MADQCFSDLSDEQLALLVQEGDLFAFDEIVRRHHHSIYRFLASKTANVSDAEDLTQETFVRAFQKIKLYKSKYRLLPWLFTIAHRQNIQLYRKRKKTECEFKDDLVDERLPSDRIEQSDAHIAIWQTIREVLPESSAIAFWLRYEEDLSLAEVASVLNLTQVHLRVLLHRSRVKLAKHMESCNQITEEESSTVISNV